MNLLAAKLYDPGTAVSKATSSLLAITAFDTTNLRLSVTVPAHGMLRFKMRCLVTGATTCPTVLLGVLNGSTVVGRVAPQYENATANAATQNFVLDAEFTVTGLTPGATFFDAAYGVEVVVASTNIKYGGPNNTTTNDAWGGFLFEVWDPQPLPTAVAGGSGGLQICGSNAATTYATLTVTGAFTVNGVSAVSQTGDCYARLGAPAGASVSVDVAAIKTDTGNLITRIPSALFSGITSFAQWLGLIAGKQTGNATARTELRATGAGSGTYDETTDSQEAIRDRGDASWVTGGAGLTQADIRTAVGLGSANLDTQLSTITAYIDTEIASLLSGQTTIIGYIDTEVAGLVTDVGTLLTRLSALRAGYLDNLSAGAVAQAATALSTTQWTNGRAALLDNLDALISSRLATAGYTTPPTADANRDAVFAKVLGATYTFEQVVKIIAAFAAGKSSGTGTTFRDLDDTQDVISGTVVAGDRTAVTLNP